MLSDCREIHPESSPLSPAAASTKSCYVGKFFQSYCNEQWPLQSGKFCADDALAGPSIGR